jgi:RimJ/RimL family protein N-acetyltransferase
MKYLLDGQETERLIYRKIKESDFDTWLEFFKDPRTTRHWIRAKKAPELECKDWYEKQWNRYEQNLGGFNALISKKTGQFLGHGGLIIQTVDNHEELEIAYAILPQYWGYGFATEAAGKCRDYAFENEFRESLISIINITNKPSQRVAEKNGLKVEKRAVYRNNSVDIYRIIKSEWQALVC